MSREKKTKTLLNNLKVLQIQTRYLNNLERVDSFIGDEKEVSEDVLRMTLVFAHAIFEDCLRQIVKWQIDPLQVDWLEELPVTVIDDKRKLKASLADLSTIAPETTIKELVSSRVQEHISLQSFNSANDVTRWITRSQLDIEPIRNQLPALDKGIKRRHKIVHEADLDGSALRPITLQQVREFVSSTGVTIIKLIAQMTPADINLDALSKLEAIHKPKT